MKKRIACIALFFVLLLNAISVSAFTCTSPGGVIPPGGSTTPVDTWVNIDPYKTVGQTQLLSVGQISCRNDVQDWIDYLSTDTMDNVLNKNLFNDMTGHLSINGVLHNIPVSPGIQILSVTKFNSVTVDINLILTLKNNPSKSILVKRGDVIGEFDFKQTNDQRGCPKCGPYRWRLRANNDMIIETTSCTINNTHAIAVQFDQLRQDLLTTSENATLYKKDKALTFNCRGGDFSQDIKITLVSDASPFSSNYIKTTNKDIGIALIYQGETIKPGSSFTSRISASNGNANITFAPVKANVDGSRISTGALSGSATLIISSP